MSGFNGAVDAGNVKKSDIVNNLTNTDPTKALAAPQGKALNDKLTPGYSTIERNIKVSNCAGIATVSFEYYTASTEQTLANTTFATVPVGMRPHFKISFVEPFGQRRIFINEDGTMFSTTDIPANANIRGYITYVC